MKKPVILATCILFAALGAALSLDQLVYERRVIIEYASPGTSPILANGFDYTIPGDGTWQAELIPNRPAVSLQGIPILIDTAVGILYEDPKGSIQGSGKRFSKGPWSHSIGHPFVTFRAVRHRNIRIWFSSSIAGVTSPKIDDKVRIFRIE